MTFGWPLAAFALYAAGMVIHANTVLWHKVRSLQGVARLQTIYVLVGTLTSEAIIVTTNVTLPMITGTTAYSRWGAVGYQVTIAAIAIAVAKYRLWDLSSIGRRTMAAALAVGSMVPVALVLLWALGERVGLYAIEGRGRRRCGW